MNVFFLLVLLSHPGIGAGWAKCPPSKAEASPSPSLPLSSVSREHMNQMSSPICNGWQQCRIAWWKWVRPWVIASQSEPRKVRPRPRLRQCSLAKRRERKKLTFSNSHPEHLSLRIGRRVILEATSFLVLSHLWGPSLVVSQGSTMDSQHFQNA